MAKIIFRLGSVVPLTENADVGEPFWDADKAALGIANGEQNPRFYPGIKIDGSLKLNGKKLIAPNTDSSYLNWSGTSLQTYYNDTLVTDISDTNIGLNQNITASKNLTVNGSTNLSGASFSNGITKFTSEVQFLGGINLSLASFAAGIIPTNFNNGDVFIAGTPHSWKAPQQVFGTTFVSRFVVDTENKENLKLNFVESRFFSKASDGSASVSNNIMTYFNSLTTDINTNPVFIRNTTARYTNKYGVRTLAPVNEARLDYHPYTGEARGLLIEGVSRNIVTNTNVNNWSFEGITKTSTILSNWTSKGLNTPTTLYETNSNSTHSVYLGIANADETIKKAYSVYVEKDPSSTRNSCYLTIENTAATNIAGYYFNLDTGAIGSSIQIGAAALDRAFVEKVSPTIYRIAIVATVNSGGSTTESVKLRCGIAFALNDSRTFAGINNAGAIRVGDAQCENNYRPSSFMDALYTKAGDTLLIPSDKFSVDNNLGSIKLIGTIEGSTTSNPLVSLESSVAGNYHLVKTGDNGAYRVSFVTASSGTIQLNNTINASIIDKQTFTIRYDYNNYARVIGQLDNVVEYYDSSIVNPTNLAYLRIGSNSASNKFLNGWIKSVSYINKIYSPVISTSSNYLDAGTF